MHNRLIIEAFKKAEKQLGVKRPHSIANLLVKHIEESTGVSITPRTLVDKHKLAKNLSRPLILIQEYEVNGLCDYMEYSTFKEFDKDYPYEKTKLKTLAMLWRKCWFKFLLYHVFLLLIGLVIYNYVIRERWMTWNDIEYIEVKFDTNLLRSHQLRAYRQDRIDNFKLIEADCSTIFFNEDGSVKVWYGRNNSGQLQCFNDYGLHPETGKTLKKITQHMINKYLCPI